MSSALRAIETVYAGHRFRSRLEARWAVFFDAIDVRWEYEPQGYMVGEWESIRYLPDFYLPDLGIWVEVKGHLDAHSLKQMVFAAFPEDRGGLPGNSAGGLNLLVLQSVPRSDSYTWPFHTCLTFRKGDVRSYKVAFVKRPDFLLYGGDGLNQPLGSDDGSLASLDDAQAALDWFPSYPRPLSPEGTPLAVLEALAAYRSARMARFEFGQVGA